MPLHAVLQCGPACDALLRACDLRDAAALARSSAAVQEALAQQFDVVQRCALAAIRGALLRMPVDEHLESVLHAVLHVRVPAKQPPQPVAVAAWLAYCARLAEEARGAHALMDAVYRGPPDCESAEVVPAWCASDQGAGDSEEAQGALRTTLLCAALLMAACGLRALPADVLCVWLRVRHRTAFITHRLRAARHLAAFSLCGASRSAEFALKTMLFSSLPLGVASRQQAWPLLQNGRCTAFPLLEQHIGSAGCAALARVRDGAVVEVKLYACTRGVISGAPLASFASVSDLLRTIVRDEADAGTPLGGALRLGGRRDSEEQQRQQQRGAAWGRD